MANAITLAKTYVPILDEKYVYEAKTAILDSNESMVKLAENGKDFLVAKMDLQGLATTSRGGKYADGDVTFSWETHTPEWDRSRMFNIDSMDNLETVGLAYGRLAGRFIAEKVVPELDAVRIAKYAEKAGTKVEGAIASGNVLLTELEKAKSVMDDAQVPEEGRILFVTPTLYNAVLNLETYRSRKLLEAFKVVVMPQSRMYTKVKLNDGTSGGQEKGGYEKDVAGKDINFIAIHPSALVQSLKHVAPKIVTPEANQDGDYWKFGYRAYGIADVLEEKTLGIYVHHVA